jgi:biopolymer transport protein ExbD
MPLESSEDIGSTRQLARLTTIDSGGSARLNIIPLIDIIFLLIIFFLVVCRFIDTENFPVDVPYGCRYAQSDLSQIPPMATVSVIKMDEQETVFAVNSEIIPGINNTTTLVEQLTEAIDQRLSDLDTSQKVVTLRIDRDVCFARAQYALAAVADSIATDVQLAAFKDIQGD